MQVAMSQMFREADTSTVTSALGCKTRHIQTVEINILAGSSYASAFFYSPFHKFGV
jgi:hypothetical protein